MTDTEKEKERQYQKKRLELFTKNSECLNKVVLSDLERQFLYSKYVKSEGDPSLRELYEVFFENVESMFNEQLALLIFPFFTEQFLYTRKIEVEAEYFNKLKFKINEFGFSFDDYNKIEDFLKEPTGSFKEDSGEKITYNDLKLFSDVMKQSLLKTVEAIFIASIKSYTKDMDDSDKAIFIELSRKESCVRKTEELIKDFAFNYYSKITALNFSDLFLLYNLEEEKAKLDLKKEDAVLFVEQEEMINDFIDSFRTNKDKKIIIRSRDIHQVFVTSDNEFVNEFEENVEDDLKFLINKLMYDFDNPSSIVVQEKTGILNPQGVEQFKVCGLIINKGDFKVIDKDLIKQMYLKIINREELEDDKSYRFFDWLYNYLPDFN